MESNCPGNRHNGKSKDDAEALERGSAPSQKMRAQGFGFGGQSCAAGSVTCVMPSGRARFSVAPRQRRSKGQPRAPAAYDASGQAPSSTQHGHVSPIKIWLMKGGVPSMGR